MFEVRLLFCSKITHSYGFPLNGDKAAWSLHALFMEDSAAAPVRYIPYLCLS
jgi:hypothetical protein